MLTNEYLSAKIGDDAAENEPLKVCEGLEERWSSVRANLAAGGSTDGPSPGVQNSPAQRGGLWRNRTGAGAVRESAVRRPSAGCRLGGIFCRS